MKTIERKYQSPWHRKLSSILIVMLAIMSMGWQPVHAVLGDPVLTITVTEAG